MHLLHRSLMAALTALALTPSALAQITISEDDIRPIYDGPGQVTSFSTNDLAALQPIAGQTGGGQTWDFTGLTYTNDGTTGFAPVNPPVPGSDDPHLSQANLIIASTIGGDTSYSYSILDADEFTVLGAALVVQGDVQEIKFIPGNSTPLPYTFGSSWVNDYETVFEPDPSPFPTEITTHEENAVVGWGTLVTPSGSAAALMTQDLTVSTTVIDPPGLPPIVTVDSSRSVTFTTEGGLGANILLNTDGTVAGGGYTVTSGIVAVEPGAGDQDGLHVEVGPNPVAGAPVRIGLVLPEAGRATVRVYDALGRQVATLADRLFAAGEQALVWDASALPAGLYVVRVEAGEAVASRRVAVVR